MCLRLVTIRHYCIRVTVTVTVDVTNVHTGCCCAKLSGQHNVQGETSNSRCLATTSQHAWRMDEARRHWSATRMTPCPPSCTAQSKPHVPGYIIYRELF